MLWTLIRTILSLPVVTRIDHVAQENKLEEATMARTQQALLLLNIICLIALLL